MIQSACSIAVSRVFAEYIITTKVKDLRIKYIYNLRVLKISKRMQYYIFEYKYKDSLFFNVNDKVSFHDHTVS